MTQSLSPGIIAATIVGVLAAVVAVFSALATRPGRGRGSRGVESRRDAVLYRTTAPDGRVVLHRHHRVAGQRSTTGSASRSLYRGNRGFATISSLSALAVVAGVAALATTSILTVRSALSEANSSYPYPYGVVLEEPEAGQTLTPGDDISAKGWVAGHDAGRELWLFIVPDRGAPEAQPTRCSTYGERAGTSFDCPAVQLPTGSLDDPVQYVTFYFVDVDRATSAALRSRLGDQDGSVATFAEFQDDVDVLGAQVVGFADR